ncbi:MAG TPA: hypothetical protein VFS09_08520 [Candidatus Eisenbacteria bacterium]|nr:hypothetical protein [Candidatus Eisenbacteria bacterium]
MNRLRSAILFVLGAGLAAPPAHAASVDSIEVSSPRPARFVEIRLEHDRNLEALHVERRADGYLVVFLPSGSREFISIHKVRAILDPQGHDRTKDVLDRFQSLDAELPPPPDGAAPDQPWGQPKQPKSNPFRGRPLPERKSFGVVEIGLMQPLTVAKEGKDLQWFALYQLGYMTNVNERIALGPAIQVEAGPEEIRGAAFLRCRRWLSREKSVEFALGGGSRTSSLAREAVRSTSAAVIAQGALNFRDLALLTLQAETYRRDAHATGAPGSPPFEPEIHEQGVLVSIGARGGGEIGEAASIAAVIVGIVGALAFFTSGY